MLTVACVLKSNRPYSPYKLADVVCLHSMVCEYLRIPFRFVCLSDLKNPKLPGVEWIPLTCDWQGWWSKLELFRPEVFLVGNRVLYFDLDTIILGDLYDIANRTEEFVGIGDFYKRPPQQPEIGFGSGMMLWTAGIETQLYSAFQHRFRHSIPGGDQEWIQTMLTRKPFLWEFLVPDQVVSYKVHCRHRIPPPGARVVCFHGYPKPSQVTDIWVKKTRTRFFPKAPTKVFA